MSILNIQFSEDFENKYLKYKTDILKQPKGISNNSNDDSVLIKLQDGLLTLNKSTGLVKLNSIEKNLNPESLEFKTLLKLMINKDCRATYKELLGDSVTKDTKRNLGFTIRNLKESLGILPKKDHKNKDIIMNIKKHGYKLIT